LRDTFYVLDPLAEIAITAEITALPKADLHLHDHRTRVRGCFEAGLFAGGAALIHAQRGRVIVHNRGTSRGADARGGEMCSIPRKTPCA
jgi:hypothetical protein